MARFIGLGHVVMKGKQKVMSGIPNPAQTVTAASAQQSQLAQNVNGSLALRSPPAAQANFQDHQQSANACASFRTAPKSALSMAILPC